jgi:hypothetical protein
MKQVIKSLENQKRDTETDEKLIRKLQAQMKRLSHYQRLAEEKNHMQFKLVEHHEDFKRALEADIVSHKKEEQTLRKQNYQLEKAREAATLNSSNWLAK